MSVIIPVFNGEVFLGEAVESIQRQRYTSLEIIIVDDGSTDGTRNVAASFGPNTRYVFQPNAGPPAARNAGLRLARGSVIGFLDADDLWTEDKLKIQVALLAEHPAVDVVLGFTRVVHRAENRSERADTQTSLPTGPVLILGAALFRRSSFERIGLFDESLRFDDDVDWFLRAKEHGLVLHIHQDVVQLYRRHGRNLTNQKELDNRFFIATLKKSLDRRRQTGGGNVQPLSRWFDPEIR